MFKKLTKNSSIKHTQLVYNANKSFLIVIEALTLFFRTLWFKLKTITFLYLPDMVSTYMK